ncbi:MAG: hypothetical protein N2559_01055 [Anaerolineae bacterium]|nr:hypothetical protein [Anaerolineae bacterium]
MSNEKFILRVGAIAGALATILLVVMILIGLQIGPDLENLNSLSPTRVAELFVTSQGKLRMVMVVDDLFALAYVIAFIALAVYARRRAAIFAWIGLGFALATGALDWLENSITLGLIAYTLPDMTRLGVEALVVLNIVTQMKFLCANSAVALFGIGIWNARALNRAAAILFWLFVPLNALAFISAPLASVRILGMMALLIVGALVLLVEIRDLP